MCTQQQNSLLYCLHHVVDNGIMIGVHSNILRPYSLDFCQCGEIMSKRAHLLHNLKRGKKLAYQKYVTQFLQRWNISQI